FSDNEWMVKKDAAWGICLQKNTVCPFHLVANWHTIVGHIHKGIADDFSWDNGKGELLYTIFEELSEENIEKAEAFSFFIDDSKGVDVTFNGQKATRFTTADSVIITMNGIQLTMKVEVIEGDLHLI